tara:strand:- start:190 stop:531 length:342 start_codon:yes stop_codon:yes gene_type:complete
MHLFFRITLLILSNLQYEKGRYNKLIIHSQVDYMKNIINNIIESITDNTQALLSLTNKSNTEMINQQYVECNYANDYYGDQHCQLKKVSHKMRDHKHLSNKLIVKIVRCLSNE